MLKCMRNSGGDEACVYIKFGGAGVYFKFGGQ